MDKTFSLTSTFKSEAHEDGSVMVRGMASTNAFDRAGDSIISDAWTKGGLNNFEKNPIILFNHDYNKPIGRATKVTPTKDGLHMEAKISKHADCADLIKDGVLGAFSVGFKVKDADYIKETDGLMIKDAELFEVSVVSVPCNQAATFSLAKSFDSEQDYEDFKKTFKSEEDSSSKEIDMSEATQTPEIDLEAFAKKVAEETAAKIAMQQAETKAAEKAEAEKTAEAEAAKNAQALEVQGKIRSGIETGAEKLVADLKKEFDTEKELDITAITAKYEADLKEKSDELEAMRNSKRTFESRGSDLKDYGKELLHAKIVGTISGKGWDTDYAKSIYEKAAGVEIGTASLTSALNIITTTAFEEELRQAMTIAPLFREIPVQSNATVIPLVGDVEDATFDTGGVIGSSTTAANAGGDVAANMLQDLGGSTDGEFTTSQKTLTTHRLVAGTFITNDTDETTLVTLAPMITSALVRAHARAVDKSLLFGVAGKADFLGLAGGTGAEKSTGALYSAISGTETAGDANVNSLFLPLRAGLGKYGLNPADVVYIISNQTYYEILADSDFQDITNVGSDIAVKLTGQLGAAYGSRVIVSPLLAGTTTNVAGLAVYTGNYVIPRLKGTNIETEYSAVTQRTALIASQALGFAQLFSGGVAAKLYG